MNDLIARAKMLADEPGRSILGITGPPGAGKSTIAARLAQALGSDTAVLVPMDGFHLSNAVLESMNSRERKGAPDTFDAAGYVALLRRLRTQQADAAGTIYAPIFDRDLDESIGSAIAVPEEVPLIITEGNYLLLDDEPWTQIRSLLDRSWFVEIDETERRRRLILRHSEFGMSRDDAYAWAHGSDETNAVLVTATVGRADLVVH